MLEHPKIKELEAKGHQIEIIGVGNTQDSDLIIGPNCYRHTKESLVHLDITIKAVQKMKQEVKNESKPTS
jgi:hypothetical protein